MDIDGESYKEIENLVLQKYFFKFYYDAAKLQRDYDDLQKKYEDIQKEKEELEKRLKIENISTK